MASSERKGSPEDVFAIVSLRFNKGFAYRYYRDNKPRFNFGFLTRELKCFRCDSTIFQVRIPAQYLIVARANESSGVSSDIYNPTAHTVGTVSVNDDGTDFATTLMAFFNAHNFGECREDLSMGLNFTDGRMFFGVTRVRYVDDQNPVLDDKPERLGGGESKTQVFPPPWPTAAAAAATTPLTFASERK
jgi:hypothetical protein